MKRSLTLILLMGISAPALAGRDISNNGELNRGNSDVVVDLPREQWTQGSKNTQPPCQRCCLYDNRNYSEGAVLKSEGVMLQCVRDDSTLGSNNLIWRILK